MAYFKTGDMPDPEAMKKMLPPTTVNHLLLQAVEFCWMLLPSRERSIDKLEAAIRRSSTGSSRKFGRTNSIHDSSQCHLGVLDTERPPRGRLVGAWAGSTRRIKRANNEALAEYDTKSCHVEAP